MKKDKIYDIDGITPDNHRVISQVVAKDQQEALKKYSKTYPDIAVVRIKYNKIATDLAESLISENKK
jgi:hypothetical protein